MRKIILFILISISVFSEYKIENGKVYYEDKLIAEADAVTFDSSTDYAQDKNYIYYTEKKIEGADLKTFEILYSGYSKDKNHVYFFLCSIALFHSLTFFMYLIGLSSHLIVL